MDTRPSGDSLARQAEQLACRIDELAIHRSKREDAKANLFAAFALVDVLVAATDALRAALPAITGDRADARLVEKESPLTADSMRGR